MFLRLMARNSQFQRADFAVCACFQGPCLSHPFRVNNYVCCLSFACPGKGDEYARKLQDKPKYHARNTDLPRTVAGWFIACTQAERAGVAHPADFLTKVADVNPNTMPTNLFLLCGDPKLDTLVPTLTTEANCPVTFGDNPYRRVHYRLRTFIGRLADYVREKEPQFEEVVVFVDTNPALSIYTQMALCSMTHLIVPTNADAFSTQVGDQSVMEPLFRAHWLGIPVLMTAVHHFYTFGRPIQYALCGLRTRQLPYQSKTCL
jgi:hypothetical protein